MSLDTGESDLASVVLSFIGGSSKGAGLGGGTGGRRSGRDEKYRIPAFFVRRRGAQHTVLFSHGNAEDLGMMYKRMKDLALALCVNILAYDYTGYGLSQGGA